jgi:hypothetical protein
LMFAGSEQRFAVADFCEKDLGGKLRRLLSSHRTPSVSEEPTRNHKGDW